MRLSLMQIMTLIETFSVFTIECRAIVRGG
jgi:hypothetical protein